MENKTETKQGYWWSPKDEDNRFAGQLHLEQGKRPTLTLTMPEAETDSHLGQLNAFGLRYTKLPQEDLLYGQTVSGPVTVCNASPIKTRTHWGGGGAQTTLTAECVLDGFILPSTDGQHIRKATVYYDNLPVWVQSSGFKLNLLKTEGNFDLSYRRPKTQRYRISEDLTLSIGFRLGELPWPHSRTVHLTEKPYVTFSATEPRTLEFFRTKIQEFGDFLTFACLHVSSYEEVLLEANFKWKLDSRDERVYPLAHYFDGQHLNSDEPASRLSHFDILFADSTPGDLSSVFRNWFDLAETLKPVRLLYRAAFSPTQHESETRFLFLCQAVEAYHRLRRPGTYMDQETFDDDILPGLKKCIPSDLQSDHRRALKDRLKWGNERSLRHRLKALYRENRHPVLDHFFGQDLVNHAVNARNALTHHGSTDDFNEAYRPHLLRYMFLLRTLLELSLLRDCGFSDAKIAELLENVRGIQLGTVWW